MIKKMIFMRGLPGSGKSTLAYQLAQADGLTSVICSADDFFVIGNEYKFDGRKIGQAHKKCLSDVKQAVKNDINIIIVDNTNTTFEEMKPYIELAVNNDYLIVLATPKTKWANNVESCAKKNTHKVPLASIIRMQQRFQNNQSVIYSINDTFGKITINNDGDVSNLINVLTCQEYDRYELNLDASCCFYSGDVPSSVLHLYKKISVEII